MAWELAGLFTRLGFPKQVVTNQRAVFMSETLRALWKLAGTQPLGVRISVYHPQTNGCMERFKSTLQQMLCKSWLP